MSYKPTLAIVGRPNVGKSALFNRICKKRIAIVDEQEGITRDRLYADADFFGKTFRVIDTGGIDSQSTDQFQEEIKEQAELAIQEADVIVMVVDGTIGLTVMDELLAKKLLKSKKQICLAVNKIDDSSQERLLHSFYKLGIERMIGVSAVQGYQIAELLELAWKDFKFSRKILPPSLEGTKVCIVGRPNVGKSTLVNALLNDKRCVESPIAGTTRDSVDIPFLWNGRPFVLIDTAGIRKAKTYKQGVEHYAALRTQLAIERSDICVLVIDVREGITQQEKRLIMNIERSGKGCVVLLNKWDLVQGFRMEHCLAAMEKESPFIAHCPTLVVSAKMGRNIEQLFPAIAEVETSRTRRITTPQLNKFLERVMQINHPPMISGKRLRIYYMTQVATSPPLFVLFVNSPDLLPVVYKRYLLNQFREHFQFSGVPLNIELRGKEKGANPYV